MTIAAADKTSNPGALDDQSERYLIDHHRGRLATVGLDGEPQNKPVGYTYNTELGTIDIAGFDMETSAKYRNIGVNPSVAFVVDDSISEGAAGMRFLEIRGRAERVSLTPPPASGVSSQIIRIRPRRVVAFNIDPDHPGLQTGNVAPSVEESEAARPSFDAENGIAQRANEAVVRFVEELQAGWDERDADITNRHFANDVLWGSPFGATLSGYKELHAIHVRLKQQGTGGPSSRFEIVDVLAPAPNVAVAQVRRVALDPDGQPLPPTSDLTGTFSEVALYVLVRRNRTWWLAAGQNTPVRRPPKSSRPA
jgi:PPOX class F420-dependent enzyme/OxyR family protein/uncharacterized protein (TIGR02246 family)